MTQPVIGVDGGGSRIRAALLWQDRRWDVAGKGANASSDLPGCIAALTACLNDLCATSGLPPQTLPRARAYLGLAGLLQPEQATKIARALPLQAPCIEEDRRAAVQGALGDAPGAVAALGTGSFLAVRDADGMRFLGGYGLALGDEASAAWLGREALTAALRADDGLVPETPFTTGLRDRFGGAGGIKRFAAEATARAFGALAPKVTRAAEAGDPTARALMQRGADYVTQGLHHLGWQSGPLVALGGIAPHFCRYLPGRMQAALSAAQGSALDGALALAQTLPEHGS